MKIYIYFDDTISGNVANVQLVDADGDVVAQSDREFEKPPSKGLYVAFKYTIIEKKRRYRSKVNSYEKSDGLTTSRMSRRARSSGRNAGQSDEYEPHGRGHLSEPRSCHSP